MFNAKLDHLALAPQVDPSNSRKSQRQNKLKKHFKVKKRDIEIISGEKSRDKKIQVAGAGIEPAT
ncbi:MAG: putative YggU family [Actinomycetota bacterium]